MGRRLYDYGGGPGAGQFHTVVQTGRFAADMKLHLVNDGPVTIPLHVL
jgi:D-tyrosyl-tRNA(Tyr) deacylase